MVNATMHGRFLVTLKRATAIAAFLLVMALSVGLAQAQATSIEPSESIVLHIGEALSVSSTRHSLQFVEIRGNMSAATILSSANYPTDTFEFTSKDLSSYSLRLTFTYPTEYEVLISVSEISGANRQKASYYISSGELLLVIEADFTAAESVRPLTSASAWDSFISWTALFGDAFPLWVKLLYAFFAPQFMVVGYKWIRFENSVREEQSFVSRFDRGNLVYLWSDVICKFLLTAFLVIAAVMSGQFILLSVLKFMFLAQVNMLNLWDLYVLGFAAGITGIAYAFRPVFEKSFDLKPLFQD